MASCLAKVSRVPRRMGWECFAWLDPRIFPGLGILLFLGLCVYGQWAVPHTRRAARRGGLGDWRRSSGLEPAATCG